MVHGIIEKASHTKKFLPTFLTYAKERAYKKTYKLKTLAFSELLSNEYEKNIKDFWAEF